MNANICNTSTSTLSIEENVYYSTEQISIINEDVLMANAIEKDE